jgi:hypothetical protein
MKDGDLDHPARVYLIDADGGSGRSTASLSSIPGRR